MEAEIYERNLRDAWNEYVFKDDIANDGLKNKLFLIMKNCLNQSKQRIENLKVSEFDGEKFLKEIEESFNELVQKLLIKYDVLKNMKSKPCFYFDKNKNLVCTRHIEINSFEKWKNKKIIFISIMGQARKGKSTFLNYLCHFFKYGQEGINREVDEALTTGYNLEYDHVTDGISTHSELIDIGYLKEIILILFNELDFFAD